MSQKEFEIGSSLQELITHKHLQKGKKIKGKWCVASQHLYSQFFLSYQIMFGDSNKNLITSLFIQLSLCKMVKSGPLCLLFHFS